MYFNVKLLYSSFAFSLTKFFSFLKVCNFSLRVLANFVDTPQRKYDMTSSEKQQEIYLVPKISVIEIMSEGIICSSNEKLDETEGEW